MFTKPLLLAAVLAVLAAAPTHASPALQGYKWNGIRWNGSVLQGHRWNGVRQNGVASNGFRWNGNVLQGFKWNGVRRNGRGVNVGDHEDASINGRVIAIEF